MCSLDPEIRRIIEKNIDNAIKSPTEHEEGFKDYLSKLDIEQSIDTVLAFFAGNLYGIFYSFYINKFKRIPDLEEKIEYQELMKTWAEELREAFILTRIK